MDGVGDRGMTPKVVRRLAWIAVGGVAVLASAVLWMQASRAETLAARTVTSAPVKTPKGYAIRLALHPNSAGPVPSWYPPLPTLTVPIPKGSVGTLAPFPRNGQSEPLPGAPHELQAQGEYRVPMDQQVGAWFAKAFAEWGYKWAGSSTTSMDWGAVIAGQSTSFSPANNPYLTVTVSWAPSRGRSSLVYYFVSDVLIPPRPASSRVPLDIVKVVVRPVSGRPVVRTVMNRGWIHRLVSAINGLRMAPGYPVGCIEPSGFTLELYTKSGRAIHVSTTCGTVTVEGADLADGTKVSVETIVGSLFPQSVLNR